MKKVKNYYSYIHVSLCTVTVLSMSSCSVVKETAFEAIADTITDPKTGTHVFTREYDTEPYQINMGEIVKSRKAQKKQKEKELLENYDKIQISN